jgi:hypothetical protein
VISRVLTQHYAGDRGVALSAGTEAGAQVHPEGARALAALGLATKAVNLRAVQSARDDLTLVPTQNAETNDYMVSINERMGFTPVEVSAEFVKRL